MDYLLQQFAFDLDGAHTVLEDTFGEALMRREPFKGGSLSGIVRQAMLIGVLFDGCCFQRTVHSLLDLLKGSDLLGVGFAAEFILAQ